MNLPSTWTHSPSRPLNAIIPPMPAVARQRLDAMNRGLTEMAPGRYMISPLAAPSEAERAWIKERHKSVLDALQPGERSAIEDKLHGFAFGFSQLRSLDVETFRGTLANYVDAVDHLPFEAVGRACRAWNKHRFKWANPAFPPQAPELAKAATEMMCEMRMEERELRILLGAVPGKPEPVRPAKIPLSACNVADPDPVAAAIKSMAPPKNDRADPAPVPHEYSAGYLADLAARKAKREAEEQASLSDQLRAGKEPFETERKGEAA